MCKLTVWNLLASVTASSSYTVLMAMERVIIIKFPIWHKTHLESLYKSLSPKLASFISIFSFLSSVHAWFAFEAKNSGDQCTAGHNTHLYQISVAIGGAVSIFLPFLILLCCNVVFAQALIRRRKQIKSRTGTKFEMQDAPSTSDRVNQLSERAKTQTDLEHSYIVMLVGTTNSFLLLNLATISLYQAARMAADPNINLFLRNLGSLPTVYIFSTNFLFYFSSGKTFRLALRQYIYNE